MNAPLVSTSHTLKPSAPGWRLTYYDAGGEPIASFWATTREAVFSMARPHMVRA